MVSRLTESFRAAAMPGWPGHRAEHHRGARWHADAGGAPRGWAAGDGAASVRVRLLRSDGLSKLQDARLHGLSCCYCLRGRGCLRCAATWRGKGSVSPLIWRMGRIHVCVIAYRGCPPGGLSPLRSARLSAPLAYCHVSPTSSAVRQSCRSQRDGPACLLCDPPVGCPVGIDILNRKATPPERRVRADRIPFVRLSAGLAAGAAATACTSTRGTSTCRTGPSRPGGRSRRPSPAPIRRAGKTRSRRQTVLVRREGRGLGMTHLGPKTGLVGKTGEEVPTRPHVPGPLERTIGNAQQR